MCKISEITDIKGPTCVHVSVISLLFFVYPEEFWLEDKHTC